MLLQGRKQVKLLTEQEDKGTQDTTRNVSGTVTLYQGQATQIPSTVASSVHLLLNCTSLHTPYASPRLTFPLQPSYSVHKNPANDIVANDRWLGLTDVHQDSQ
jgi:hypothetical protein